MTRSRPHRACSCVHLLQGCRNPLCGCAGCTPFFFPAFNSNEIKHMKYIKTGCPQCGGSIEFSDDDLFKTVECPHCKESIELVRPPFQMPVSVLVTTCIVLTLVKIILAVVKTSSTASPNSEVWLAHLSDDLAPLPFLYLMALIASLFAKKENRRGVLCLTYSVLIALAILVSF